MPHDEKVLEKAEAQGRGGDQLLGHLTPGDIIIPGPRVTPEILAMLQGMMDVDVYTAGNERNSLNPYTGLPEFNAGADGYGQPGGFDGGFDPGAMVDQGYGSAVAEAAAGKEGANGLGANPGSNGSMGFGLGLGGFMDMVGGTLANPSNAGLQGAGNTMDQMGTGGGIDGTQSQWQPQVTGLPPVQPSAQAPALPLPMAPQVPVTPAPLGQYYGALLRGENDYAQNLLAPYLSRNLYGR